MCDQRRYRLIEYVEKASKKFGYPYEFVAKAVDSIYQKLGDELFSFLDELDSALSSFNGKKSLEEHILTFLPREAFQGY